MKASKGFPTQVTSPLMPPKPHRTKVRQHLWRRNELCMHIRLLKPLETKKEEENHRKDGEVTAPHLIHEKTMTSLSLSRQKSEGQEQQCSVNTERSKSETNQLVHVYPYTTNIYTESRKEQREIKFKRPGAANCQDANDVMDDGITRGGEVNRLVARERYATTKHSFSHIREFLKTTLNISKQSLVQLAIIFAVVINLIGSGLNMNLLKLVCIAGLAVVVCQECGRTRCAGTALETITFTVNVFGGKHIKTFANVYASWIDYFNMYTRNLESEYRIMIFCKLVYLYICAFYILWVSCEWATLSSNILYTLVYLLLKWINSAIRIHDKCKSCFLVGLALTCKASSQIRYILLHYRSNWRELRPLVTPWANCIKESIEPCIGYGPIQEMARASEKCWLNTPTTTTTCIGQKRFMPSHAQVSHLLSLLSPSLLLLCFGFYCSYYYYCYYCCYEYFTVKGSHKSSGYENKPEHENSNDYECKFGQNLLSLFLLSSLRMLLTLVCGAGDLTHTGSSVYLPLQLSLSLLMTVVCAAGDLAHTTSPACLYIF